MACFVTRQCVSEVGVTDATLCLHKLQVELVVHAFCLATIVDERVELASDIEETTWFPTET